METEAAYFRRLASEERELCQARATHFDKLVHLSMAEYFESLARAVEANRRRLSFHEVKASQRES